MATASGDYLNTVRIPADDVTLVADTFGPASRMPVVLLHGGGQTRHAWRATGQQLAATGWHALSVDMRGHGDSGWSADRRYDLDRFADDVGSIAGFLNQPPVLVGASLGGNAALAALGRDRALARGLVLVDVAPFLRPEGTRRIREFMTARPDGFASVDEAADAVATYLPHRSRPGNQQGLRKNLREVGGRYFWHWDPALLSEQEEDVQRQILLDQARLRAASETLRIPTLLLRGSQSDVLGVEEARQFLELVPHAEYRDIAGARHMVAGDDNTAFGAVLADFLERRIRTRP